MSKNLNKNLKIKRLLSSFLTASLIFSFCMPSFGQSQPDTLPQAGTVSTGSGKTFQTGVDYSELDDNKDMFTGQIEDVKKGAKLKMTVSSVETSGFHLKGDDFFAEVTDDFSTRSGVVIPSGTIAHGNVTEIKDPKRLGRDAYMTIKFDYLITPDKRKIPIAAAMTTKRNAAASVGKVVLEDTAYTVAGGVIGGILAFRFLGMGVAVASHGYSLAGGAGIGAIIGMTASLIRKGNEVLIQPGDEIKVNVNESISLPVMSEKALREEELVLEGLNVRILGYTVEKDPFGELNTINLVLDIKNNTDKTFSSFDMALLSENNTVYYASPFGDTSMWFTKVTPNTGMRGSLSFSVDNPKKKHWLVFYDSSTRKPLAKFSLKNAEREIKKLSRDR